MLAEIIPAAVSKSVDPAPEMKPLVDVKFRVPAVRVPAVWLISPLPVAIIVRVFAPPAVTLLPRFTFPLAAVDCSVRFVVDETSPVVEMSPLADNVRAPLVAVMPVEVMEPPVDMVAEPTVPLTAVAPLSFIRTIPDELMRILAALLFRLPIVPVPPLRTSAVVDKLPADWLMVPVPTAVRVSVLASVT